MMNNEKIKEVFGIIMSLLLILIIVFFTVEKGLTDENVSNLMKEEIFSYTTLILFCATILSALVAMLAFLFLAFDRINTKMANDEVGTRGIKDKQDNITEEIKQDIYSIFGTMFCIFIYMIVINSKLVESVNCSWMQFLCSTRGTISVMVYAYIIVFIAIWDIVTAILKTMQESYKN